MTDLRFSYAVNQWRIAPTTFVRLEHHERVFKSLSALGFRAIELFAGTGRWSNLGRPEHLRLNYGSAQGFRDKLAACGIQSVSGMTWDPAAPMLEDGPQFLSTSRPSDHDAIVAAAVPYFELLAELGSDRLIVRATESAWALGDRFDPAAVAAAFDALGRAGAEHGVRVTAEFDCLGAVRGRDGIDAFLAATDPGLVDLSVGTADLTVAGVDPVALIRDHAARVGHVHLKDTRYVDSGAEYLMPNAEIAMLQGSAGSRIQRWFFELGTEGGLVDVDGVIAALRDAQYAGWVVIESDQSPHPMETAMLNAWTVQKIQGGSSR